MGNDTNRTSVRIKPDDIIELLGLRVMHFDGLDIVYKSLRFDHAGIMINLHEEYCETFLSSSQKKDIEDLKLDAKNAGIELNVNIDTYIVSDATLEIEDEMASKDTWCYDDFAEQFRSMADAISFFEHNHSTQDLRDNDSKIRGRIKSLLADCIQHL